MTKTKNKVMSLILATSLVMWSFLSLNLASAATETETGELNLDGGIRNLISEKLPSDLIGIDEIVGSASITTYDHESISDVECVKANHVSGDRLIRIEKKDDEYYFVVRGNVSGKEVIRVCYQATYERDNKEVTVKANKEITFYAYQPGEVFLGKAGVTDKASKPGSIPTAAVNQKYLDIGVYFAQPAGDTGLEKITAHYGGVNVNTVQAGEKPVYVIKDSGDVVLINRNALDLKNSKVFNKVVVASLSQAGSSAPDTDSYKNGVSGELIDNNTIRLVTTFKGQTAATEGGNIRKTAAKLVNVGSSTLKMKLGIVSDAAQFRSLNQSKQSIKVSSEKKYDADLSLEDGIDTVAGEKLEINKKSGKTYLNIGSLDWDNSNGWKEHQKTMDAAVVVGSYDKITTTKHVSVLGGSIGNLTTDNAKTIVVEAGSTGDLSAGTVDVQGGVVGGTIGAKTVTVSDGKVQAIDDGGAVVTIDGGEITGNITGKTIEIGSNNGIHIVVGGKVTAKGNADDCAAPAIHLYTAGDASVTVKGELKGDVLAEGDNIILANINANYKHTVVFNDFNGIVKAIVNTNKETAVEVNGKSVVSLSGTLTADSVTIEKESKLKVEEADIGSIGGEGQLIFPAGKLHIGGEIDDTVKLVVSDGLAVSATAFTSEKNMVDSEKLNLVGFTLTSKPDTSAIDRHVITSLVFAGVKFDKTELRIAKGYSDTLTIQNGITGTFLPTGAKVEWSVEANDDFITVTVDEATNTATVRAIDFDAEHIMGNKGRITATVVDENGVVLDKLIQAEIQVTVLEKPDSAVTLDTTKPVTIDSHGLPWHWLSRLI